MVAPSKKKRFLMSKPSLTINYEEEFLESQGSSKMEKSQALSPMTNISSQEAYSSFPKEKSMHKSKLLKRSQSSKHVKVKLLSNSKRKNGDLMFSNEKSLEKSENIKSVRLEYFGGEIQ